MSSELKRIEIPVKRNVSREFERAVAEYPQRFNAAYYDKAAPPRIVGKELRGFTYYYEVTISSEIQLFNLGGLYAIGAILDE